MGYMRNTNAVVVGKPESQEQLREMEIERVMILRFILMY
jgi:hypothetical protein